MVLRRKILCFQNILGATESDLVLNFRSSLMLRCQIAAWSCNHLGCYCVNILSLTCKSLLLRSKILVLNLQTCRMLRSKILFVLSLTLKHVGWYAVSSCPWRTRTRTRTRERTITTRLEARTTTSATTTTTAAATTRTKITRTAITTLTTRTRTKTRTREIITSSWKIWMLPKKILSWTLKHLVWFWLLWSKTLSLTFNHLGCYKYGVRSCPWHSIILDATLEELVLNFEHLGSYAQRPCSWITNILNLGCHAVRPCP